MPSDAVHTTSLPAAHAPPALLSCRITGGCSWIFDALERRPGSLDAPPVPLPTRKGRSSLQRRTLIFSVLSLVVVAGLLWGWAYTFPSAHATAVPDPPLKYITSLLTMLVCWSSAYVFSVLYTSGVPLAFGTNSPSPTPHSPDKGAVAPRTPDERGEARRDRAWFFLGWALFILGFGGIVGLIEAADVNIRWLTAIVSIEHVKDLVSMANNVLFLEALFHIDRNPGRRTLPLLAPLRKRPSLRRVALIALLLMFLATLGGFGTAPTSFAFTVSVVVLALYSMEVTLALVERGMSGLIVPWFLGLSLQALQEVVSPGSNAALPSWLHGMLGISAPQWAPDILAVGAKTLICVTLLGQALSWYLAVAIATKKDLVAVRKQLQDAIDLIPDSPLADRLSGPLHTVEERAMGHNA
jgi:hypothetical protein